MAAEQFMSNWFWSFLSTSTSNFEGKHELVKTGDWVNREKNFQIWWFYQDTCMCLNNKDSRNLE